MPATPSRGAGVQRLSKHAQWIGPGTPTKVKGFSIPGGMLYVGRGLRAPTGVVEPAQIDPNLKVHGGHVDMWNAGMGYWPRYDAIDAAARAGYLAWLAGGRRDPHVDIGFVFLFFYGLERRVLVDLATDGRVRQDLPAIRWEVCRLLDLFGDSTSFRGYASRFLDLLDLQTLGAEAGGLAPPKLDDGQPPSPPLSLRVGLGALVSRGMPIPADWALAWSWYHPDIRLRTPVRRCPEEFKELFRIRYQATFGEGLTVPAKQSGLQVRYEAASSGIGQPILWGGVPDVVSWPRPTRQLRELVESVTIDLDALSRYLGRYPEDRHSATASALLPDELAEEPTPAVRALLDWATDLADTTSTAPGAELLALWSSTSAERLAKPDAVTLARLLARHGLGIEPDIRLGGPSISSSSSVVTFRTGSEPQPAAATAAYAGATTLLHLATAVAAADGEVSTEEQDALVHHLESALELSAGERVRLEAHMRWLAASGVKLGGLRKRVNALTPPQRATVADLLVTVAAADGVISPAEVKSLSKIFELLELDPEDVHSRVHALAAGSRPPPASRPITVRAASSPDHGYPVVPPSDSPTETAEVPFRLDDDVIETKFAETAAVGALLADIFDDEEPLTTDRGGTTCASAPKTALPSDGGLDPSHAQFLGALLGQQTWSRAEIEALADDLHLMPDGALDVVNEYAIDRADEPLVEEATPDSYTVNEYALKELSA